MASAGERDADPWSDETKNKFENKSRSEWFDPCQDAASRSIRCLNRNGGDRSMCQDYFEAYRDCKKQWMNQRKEQRKKSGALF